MKAARVVLIVLVTSLLIIWVRGGEEYPVAHSFPFLGGDKPGWYEAGALIMLLVIFPWGLARLRRRQQRLDDAERFSPGWRNPDDEFLSDHHWPSR